MILNLSSLWKRILDIVKMTFPHRLRGEEFKFRQWHHGTRIKNTFTLPCSSPTDVLTWPGDGACVRIVKVVPNVNMDINKKRTPQPCPNSPFPLPSCFFSSLKQTQCNNGNCSFLIANQARGKSVKNVI